MEKYKLEVLALEKLAFIRKLCMHAWLFHNGSLIPAALDKKGP